MKYEKTEMIVRAAPTWCVWIARFSGVIVFPTFQVAGKAEKIRSVRKNSRCEKDEIQDRFGSAVEPNSNVLGAVRLPSNRWTSIVSLYICPAIMFDLEKHTNLLFIALWMCFVLEHFQVCFRITLFRLFLSVLRFCRCPYNRQVVWENAQCQWKQRIWDERQLPVRFGAEMGKVKRKVYTEWDSLSEKVSPECKTIGATHLSNEDSR